MKLATYFLKKLSYNFLLVLALICFNSSFGQIISQYIETNSGTTPKGIEIWNNTGSTLNFSSNNLVIEKGTNGGSPSTDATVDSGTLAAGVVMVIGSSDIGTYLTNQGLTGITFVTKGFTFNGDDALVVKYGGTITDMFGLSGNDPGTHWSGSGVSTKNSNIRLIDETDSAGSGISTGDTDGWTDPSSRFVDDGYTPSDADGLTGFGEAPITTAWDGSTNTAWGTAANWSNGVPAATSNISIPNVTNDPVISSTGIQVTNLTVESSGVLTINAGKDLTLSGDFSNSGTVTMSSDADEYSSLIVEGTSSGDITYNVWVASTTTWDLVGSPVNGASVDATSLASNGGDYAIQPYNNQTNAWTQTTASSVSTTLGKGYAMAMSSAGTVVFTGSVYVTGDGKDYTISNYDGVSSGTQWNLVANPYPSFLALNSSTSGTDTDFITQNATTADVLGSGSNEDAVWAWDGSTYQTYNNSDGALYIAPGQGFFVASKSGTSNTLKFLESMQTTNTGDNFISGDSMDPDDRAELFIGVSQADIDRYTKIYFLDNTTDGSDATYDGRSFPMGNNNTSIYSRLVEGDQGVDLGVQALAYSELWDKVIPIVINAMAGEEMTVSVTHKTTPADLKIYLEDTQEGTFTLINNEDFVLMPSSDLSGIGRFFIHTTENALSNEEVNTSLLNAYKGVDHNYITIEGLATQATSTEVSLYNILGTKVMDTTLDNTVNTQTISTNGFSTGIYIIKLESGKNQLTKKLIIK